VTFAETILGYAGELSAAILTPWVGLLLVIAYLVGSVPFGLLLARRFADEDVRAKGSGNIGATNVARVAGRRLGIVTLLLDALKGALFVIIARYLFAESPHVALIEISAGGAAFVGHCFSIWLRFKGGKGVATAAGVFFAHMFAATLVGFFTFIVVYALGRRVSLGAIVAGLSMAPAYFFLGTVDATSLVLGAMLVIMIGRHHANIRRLWNKQELSVDNADSEPNVV